MKKVKRTVVENGFEREIEVEVPDNEVPKESWGDLSKMRILGKRNPRSEGPEKVTGRAKYASDIVLPGMCYGRFLPSETPAGKIKSIDLGPALRMLGVKAAVAMKNAGDSVMWVGQHVAAVAAITPEIAEDAIRAIKIEYDVQPFVVDERKAAEPGAPKVRPNTDSNIAPGNSQTRGKVDEAFAQADVIHEGTYVAQTRLHCCLETHGHTAKWDGDKLTIWSSTQNIPGILNEGGGLAGGKQNVQVICEHMGGGFGSKFGLYEEGQMAVRLAKMANAPVKFFLTRWDEQTKNWRGPGAVAKIRLGAKKDGALVAADIDLANTAGVEASAVRLNGGPYVIWPSAQTPYRVKSYSILTNSAGQAALRAPGSPQAEVLWAAVLDDMAARLGMDPLELRRKNHNDPVRLAEFEIGAKIIGWDRRRKTPGSGPGVKKRGIGMGTGTWGGGGGDGSTCTVVVRKDGSVDSICGVQDLGTGARTYVAAIVAEELGLELNQVRPLVGRDEYGPGHASGGSTTTGSIAPPVKIAAVRAKEKLLAYAANALKVKPEEIDLLPGGRFQVKDQPGKSLTWKQLCASLPADGIKVVGDWKSGSNLQASGAAGATFAEVDVDTETGKVEVLKVVGVQDCGFVLNRLQAESQVVGAIIQGIGTALLEERHMDNVTGRMLNPNFENYKLCGAMEAGGVNIPMDPPYRTLRPNERGVVAVIHDVATGTVIGIGEPAVIGVQAAVMNAIFNATGARVAPPATPDRVLAALARKKGASA